MSGEVPPPVPVQVVIQKAILCCSCNRRCYGKQNQGLKSKHPVLLDCGHCMCDTCYHSATGSVISCGSCGSLAQVSSKLHSNLRRNAYLMGRVLLAQKLVLYENLCFTYSRKQVKPSFLEQSVFFMNAGSCYECSHKATLVCQQCKCNYCNTCWSKIHSSGKSLRKHTPLSVKSMNLRTVGTCAVHEGKQIEFFCRSCKIYGCSHCVVLNHQGENHKPATVKERNMELFADIDYLQKEVEENIERMVNTMKEVKTVREQCGKSLTATLQKTVLQNFVYLHGVLQIMEESILEKLSNEEKKKMDSLEDVLSQLEQQIDISRSVLKEVKFVRDSEQLKSEVSLDQLLHVLQNLKDTPSQLAMPNTEDRSSFMVKQPTISFNEKIVQDLKHCCTVNFPNDKIELVNTKGETNADLFLFLSEDNDLQTGHVSLSLTSWLAQRILNPHSQSVQSLNNPLLSFVGTKSKQNVAEGCSYGVHLCYVKDPGEFYVIRSSVREQQQRIAELAATVSERYSGGPKTVNKDEFYLAEYATDKKWYRGRVVDVLSPKNPDTEPNVLIYYLDYGNTQEVPISRLRQMPKILQSEPPMAMKCRLFGCVPKNGAWCKESTRMMLEILKEGIMTMYVMKVLPDILEVDLCQRSQGESTFDSEIVSLRDSMVFMEYSAFVAGSEDSQRKKSSTNYPCRSLPSAGSNFWGVISFVESCSHFYVQRMGPETRYFLNLMEKLNALYDKNNQKGFIYNPVIGMPCSALYLRDKKWYRAEITDLPGNEMITVFYVDYGNEETVHWKLVRKLKPDFLKMVPQAMRCSLKKILPLENVKWKSDSKSYLETLFSESLEVTVASKENNTLEVVLHTSSKVCINAKLLEGVVEDAKKEDSKASFNAEVSDSESSADLTYDQEDNSLPFEDCNGHAKNKESHQIQQISEKKFNYKILAEEEIHDNIEVSFKTEVQILHVTSPSDIYVSVKYFSSRIEELEKELKEFYEFSEAKENESWELNDECAALSYKHKKWVRGTVSEMLKNGMLRIKFQDTVESEELPVSNLRKLEKRFLSCPVGAIKCHLSDIYPAETEWPGLTCEFLINELENHEKIYVTKMGELENNSLPIQILVKNNGQCGAVESSRDDWIVLNDLIIEQGLAVPKKAKLLFHMISSNECSKEMSKDDSYEGAGKNVKKESDSKLGTDVKFETCDIGQESITQPLAYVACDWIQPVVSSKENFIGQPTYVDGGCIIYMHDAEMDGPSLQLINRSLLEHYKDSTPTNKDYFWKANQICVVKYYLDNGWYRGKILEVKDDLTYRVLFVDYGNVENCQASDLRRDVKYFDVPILSRKYKLYGISPLSTKWNINVSDYIYSTIVEKKCKVTVVERAIDPHGVSSIFIEVCETGLDLAEDLVNSGLATFNVDYKSKREDTVNDLKEIFNECSCDIEILPETSGNPSKSVYSRLEIPAGNDYFPIEVLTVREFDFSAHILDHESILPDVRNVILEFVSLTDEIQRLAENQPNMVKFASGEPCISLYSNNGKWYRAEIVHPDLERDLILVYYVDYGNKECVTRDRVRQSLPEWITVPKMALDFKLHKVRKHPSVKKSAYLAGLTQCLSQTGLMAKIIEKRDTYYEVEIKGMESSELVYQKLINQGLIEIRD